MISVEQRLASMTERKRVETMPRRSRSEEIPPPLQMIGDLVFSPGTDIPFGKQVRIGLTERTIYESAIEKGYRTGVRAHQAFLKDHKTTTPIVLDDKQCVYLGIEPPEAEEIDEADEESL